MDHLKKYISEEKLPLCFNDHTAIVNSDDLCRFCDGGNVTLLSNKGSVVIGGTVINEEEITPLKKGDLPTTTNIENKLPTNPTSYKHAEKQLFANMHLSAAQTMISGLIKGDIDPDKVERILSYGAILKPGCNLVALYKLIAVFNQKTYIQIDYNIMIQTIYWHTFFDHVLLYTFNKLV